MGPVDIIILIAALGIVVGVAVWSIVKKKTGKGGGCGCGCGCSGCPYGASCPSKPPSKSENEQNTSEN